MNIFWLDSNLELNASYYMDSHVRKIILECAQIMSTTCHHYGHRVRYKPTHVNHPLCKWARMSESNYELIRLVAEELNKEYRYRFNKSVDHASYSYIMTLPKYELIYDNLTRPPLCLPSECVQETVVESYRDYYRLHKRKLAMWTNRSIPPWWY